MYNDYDYNFRDLGGKSALRKGKLIYSCPTCERKNMLSQDDKDRGYQCDLCANALEGDLSGEY